MEKRYSDTLRGQHNAKLRGVKPEPLSLDDLAQMLTDYINLGHEILGKRVEFLRVQLEKGEPALAQKS
jgi:hypothetical protein